MELVWIKTWWKFAQINARLVNAKVAEHGVAPALESEANRSYSTFLSMYIYITTIVIIRPRALTLAGARSSQLPPAAAAAAAAAAEGRRTVYRFFLSRRCEGAEFHRISRPLTFFEASTHTTE